MNPQVPPFADMNLAEKLRLVEDLWDDIAASPEPLPTPQWQKDELDRRRNAFRANPDSAVTWEEAKRRIRGQDG